MSAADARRRVGSLVRRVIVLSAALAIAMSVAATLFGHSGYIASIVAGAAIAMAGFLALALTVRRSLAGGSSGLAVAGIGILKLIILGAALWWLFSMKLIEPMLFLAGFSSVVLALIIEGLRLSRKA